MQITIFHTIVLAGAAFLRMLCAMKWGIYVFFGVWQFMAILFTYFLVPETRGLAIEEVCVLLNVMLSSRPELNLSLSFGSRLNQACAQRFSA